jgi:hypothetical protein
VGGALDVARQDVGDRAAAAHLGVKRVDRRAGDAEGLRHAFLFHHQHGSHGGFHLGHRIFLDWGCRWRP